MGVRHPNSLCVGHYATEQDLPRAPKTRQTKSRLAQNAVVATESKKHANN